MSNYNFQTPDVLRQRLIDAALVDLVRAPRDRKRISPAVWKRLPPNDRNAFFAYAPR